MGGLLLFAFLAIIAVDIWAAVAVMCRPQFCKGSCALYWLVVLLMIVTTVVMTGCFSYYSNPNTHVFGWPIPHVVFQRDTPDSPWLDYVGPTVVLAYPMNFVIFMFIPSAIFVLLSRRRKHEARTEV
jgi:hypothetical protein